MTTVMITFDEDSDINGASAEKLVREYVTDRDDFENISIITFDERPIEIKLDFLDATANAVSCLKRELWSHTDIHNIRVV